MLHKTLRYLPDAAADRRAHPPASLPPAEWNLGRPSPLAAALALAAALPLVLALPLLAGRYIVATHYWTETLLGATAFGILALACSRLNRVTGGLVRVIEKYHVFALALLPVGLGVAIRFLVFDDVPHLSDEVAYQFQARALAQGGLSIPAQRPEFFGFLHTVMQDGRWYGIMNPGWPALLALGELAGIPWLVNPLLSGATLLFLFAFLRRAGYDGLEARLAVLLLAVSPFLLFMSGTLMAHPANLLLFAVFLWAGAATLDTGRLRYAVAGGLALAGNVLVRPLDTAVVSLPFIIYFIYRASRQRRLLLPLYLGAAIGAVGIVATLLYNQALTGDYRLMPVTKFFQENTPGQAFGLGFGADVGTEYHGDEWPGYYPRDAMRVTSYRLAQLLLDVHGLPLILMAALLYPLFDRDQLRKPWHLLLLLSALCVGGVYVFHFYPGSGYGSRHFYLLLPFAAVTLARPVGAWIRSPHAGTARLARGALLAGLLYAVTVPYVRLLPLYSNDYRQASGVVRDAVQAASLNNALVFVSQERWAWKAAIPLNRYPLARSNIVFAKDRGPENEELMHEYPGRTVYLLRIVRGGHVEILPLRNRDVRRGPTG